MSFPLNMTSMPTSFHDHDNEAMSRFVHPSPKEEEEEDESTTAIKTPSDEVEEEEESSVTVTPSTSEDWSEEYPSDVGEVEDQEDTPKVNGTGLILYVTPTATKATYWKRRVGWKPNMAKSTTKRIKNIFRAPVRQHIRKGGYDLAGADALAVDPKKKRAAPPAGFEKDRKWASDEELVSEYGTKDFEKLGAVNHELVFA